MFCDVHLPMRVVVGVLYDGEGLDSRVVVYGENVAKWQGAMNSRCFVRVAKDNGEDELDKTKDGDRLKRVVKTNVVVVETEG